MPLKVSLSADTPSEGMVLSSFQVLEHTQSASLRKQHVTINASQLKLMTRVQAWQAQRQSGAQQKEIKPWIAATIRWTNQHYS